MVYEPNIDEWNKLRSNIYIRDKGICWICNTFVELSDYELGHLVDKTTGGLPIFDNVVVMHTKCNATKPLHRNLEECLKWKLSLNYKCGIEMPILKKSIKVQQAKLDKIKPLTITWMQGRARWFIPPREDGKYYSEDKFSIGSGIKVNGCTKWATGKGSIQSTLEIIGDSPDINISDTLINIGVINALITKVNGKLNIVMNPDSKKSNWKGINKYTRVNPINHCGITFVKCNNTQ